jgi:drug/metabolite transporter (DMT)-like permease
MTLAFAAIYLAWGSSYLATRIGVRELPPFLFAGVRFICAGFIMLCVARWREVRIAPSAAEWRDLSVSAFFGFLIANGVGVWTIQYMPSNVSALLNTTVPCWMVLLGAFGSRAHRPGSVSLLGLLLGATGALLLIEPWSHHADGSLGPKLVLVGGCLGWAINSVHQRNMMTRMPVFSLIGWQMLLGGVLLALLGVATDEAARWQWQWHSLLPLSYLIVVASCIAHTAYAWLAPRTTPTSLGTYAYVNPLIATLLGWAVLGEALNPTQLLGMALVLTSVLLINWAARRRR